MRVAFSDEHVYEYSIDHYDAASVTQISHADLIAAANDIRAYFYNREDYLRTLVHDQDGNVVPLFSPKEVAHMHDVKALVHRVYAVGAVALCGVLAYLVALGVWSREESLVSLARRMLQACAGTGLLLIVFGFAAATGGFDNLFVQFHELSFGNDFWQLDPARDHLVQMFPQGFWLDATVLIAGLTVVEIALIGLVAFLYLRHAGEADGSESVTAGSAERREDAPQPVA